MKKIVIGVFSIFLLISGSLFVYEDYWHRKAIPENIGLSYRISIGTDSDFMFSGCGVAVYRLDSATYEQILEHGLAFFVSSTRARGHISDYYKYSEWKETPRHDWRRYEDWSYQFHCGNLSENLYKKILKYGKSQKSYYALRSESALMVIPEERLVVFTFND